MTRTEDVDWPFGNDADQDDPLTKLRIAVTGRHPRWCYLVAFDRGSEARPTDAEAAMLASYLIEYKYHWYNDSYLRKLHRRPLDVDGGANGVIFRKYGVDDWGYRRQSWTHGPMYVPQSPKVRGVGLGRVGLGPLTLAQVMDHTHQNVDEVSPRWLEWKAAHPEVFPPEG
ncbi:hypothetical protein [Streptomyces sp. 5-10]|uniref:hypothetical protein n=1 Tax=Streptomyces sp. 5-10 TaxID=878925 RepID=UPI00168ACF5E|nr:hypothetical protein [Streptomyces sp. 5-10]MBD3004621.1 hypothetical protein [Streptomyces sp. 5-10]